MIFTYEGETQDILKDFTALYTRAENLMKSFEKQEQQDILKKLPKEIKHYLRASFLKMFNLFTATHKLISGELPLPNEAKSIVRSMFEHCFNFSYIMNSAAEGEQIEEEQIEKIKRFFKYQEDIEPFNYAYKSRNSLAKQDSMNPKDKEFLEYLNDCITENSVEKKRGEYIQKYGKNLSHWSGEQSFKEMARSLKNDDFFWIYKIYVKYCAEVHSANLLGYVKDDGEFCNAVDPKNIVEVCFFCNTLYSVFLAIFFGIVDLDQTASKLYEDEFDRLTSKYQMKFS